MAVGLAPVVQAGHGLLAHIATLAEAHGAVVEPGILGDDALIEVDPKARTPALDAQALGCLLRDGLCAVLAQRGGQVVRVS